ncbi:MAG: nickel-dependent lactate racemase [Aminobacterium colombiense]|jgi:nickel-dependent lactate racemase|uniref:nickel-dependent lactate racemase n=1 Tax=Aminobacterium colombiense TaxID=81468 RepID=UPI0016B90057|nr:nickel-dependent lactate racemase [Aminobacterium colombiense]NLK29463.1 nickel-dependent lactate racemase [Aminobacterium colombiense]
MNISVSFTYPDFEGISIPEENLVAILSPACPPKPFEDDMDAINRGLDSPIGAPRLEECVRAEQKILILADDNTRNTPAHIIIPEVIKRLKKAGIQSKNISIMVALGTHRPMTEEELKKKFGSQILQNFTILQHAWNDPDQLIELPPTENGTEIWVNKALLKADFVIGIGHITPHRVVGFSGGAKIVQPGVSGGITTGQTHWVSALYDGEDFIGKIDTPVRREMNAVGLAAGLKYIVNVVMDGNEEVYRCVAGDPIEAHKEGCSASKEIYGAPLPCLGDIVIAESFPADAELWQAAKGIYSGDLALKKDGILILVTPCPDGVAQGHPELTEIGYLPFKEIKQMVDEKEIDDLTLAAHISHVGRVVCDKGRGILVSRGIDKETTEKLGLLWASTPQKALEMAFELKGSDAQIVVLKNGGDILPLLND